jgi:abnormal spindle-like microcephaly-associated protein
MVQGRQRYTTLKEAALTIQLRYRAVLLGKAVQRNYNVLKSAAVVIQKHYRGFTVRKEVERIRAAIRIQATYKAYVCRRNFLEMKRCVVTVQSNLRKLLAVKRFQVIRQAVITLQARYRAQEMMRQECSKYLATRKCAVLMQALVRGLKARNRYVALRKATICLQTRYRANVAATENRNEYLRLRNSVMVFQSAFRAYKARKLATKMRAARTIQSFYKMLVARKNYVSTRDAVVKIQAYVRMRKASSEFAKLKSAAVTCQALLRANQQCTEQRKYYTSLRENVIHMQSLRRGNMARRRVKQIIEDKRMTNDAATKIQRYYRGYLQMQYSHLYFHYIRGAIITIQSVYRGHVARENTRRVRAARTIQTYYRGFVARKSYRFARQSIINVQALVRCNQVRMNYLKTKRAAIACQQRYQATKSMREELQHYQQTKIAITKVQAVWRGHMQRERYLGTLQSIVVIQSAVKMCIARISYQQMRDAAMVLQCRYRALCSGRVVRRDYGHLKNATFIIQVRFSLKFGRNTNVRKYVTVRKCTGSL